MSTTFSVGISRSSVLRGLVTAGLVALAVGPARAAPAPLLPAPAPQATTFTLPPLERPVFSPGGEFVAGRAQNNQGQVWSLVTGKHVGSYSSPQFENRYYGSTQAVSRDGKRVLIRLSSMTRAPRPDKLTVIDVPSGAILLHLEPTQYGAATLSPDGTLLARTNGGEVSLSEVSGGKARWAVLRHGAPAQEVAFSADGKRLLTVSGRSGTQPGMAIVWDVATGRALRSVALASGKGWLSPDGRVLVTHEPERQALLTWSVATGQALHALELHGAQADDLAFSADGRRLIAVGRSGAKAWELLTGRATGAVAWPSAGTPRAVVTAEGRRLACGDGAAVRFVELARVASGAA
jgi:WD40 repeat protein